MVCRLLFVAFREPIFEENLNKYAKMLACNNLEIQHSILYGILCVYSRHFLVHNVDSKNLKNPFYCVVSLELLQRRSLSRQAQYCNNHGRRHGLWRCRVLWRKTYPNAKHRPSCCRGYAFYPMLRRFHGLCTVAECVDDRASHRAHTSARQLRQGRS